MESTGYPMASIEKTMRLLELLRVINEDAFLSENLTLKGGTAINIIGQNLPPCRFDGLLLE